MAKAKNNKTADEPIEKQLWKSADKLRKNIDAAEYKHIVLGLIFLPWATLMYVAVAPGGVNGFWEWLFLILAIVIDVGSYAGGGIGNRNRVPGYSG